MKKVMFVLAVAGMFAFAACNNNAPEEPAIEENQEQVEATPEETTEEATDAEAEATEGVAEAETPAAE